MTDDRAGAPPAERPVGSVIARNSLLNLVGLGSPLLAAVVAIPPLVAGLGNERFGLLGLVWVGIAYLNLLDLGLGRATTRFAAGALARGEESELREIVGVAASWQAGLGLLGGVLTVLAAGPLVDGFLNLSPGVAHEAFWSFATLAAAAPAIAMTSSFRGVLEAGQRFGVINAVRVPVSTANFLVPLVGMWLGTSLPTIVSGLVVIRVLALAGYALVALRAWPALRGPITVAADRLAELLRYGSWVTVSSIAAALLLYVDRFVLGGIESVTALGYYTVPHEMVVRLEILPASLVLALFPALAGLSGPQATDANERLRRAGSLVSRSVEALLVFVTPVFLALAIFAHDVLAVWMDVEFAAGAAPSLRPLALGMAATALAYVPYAAIHAAGRPDITARIQLIELPVYAVLLVSLTRQWGIEGAAFAWMLRAVLDAALMFDASRRLGFGSFEWSGGTRIPALIAALIGYALVAIAGGWLLPGGEAGIALAIGWFMLWIAGAWRWWLNPAERHRLRAVAGWEARPRSGG